MWFCHTNEARWCSGVGGEGSSLPRSQHGAEQGCSSGVTQRLHTACVQRFSLASLQLMNVTGGEAGGKWSRNARLPCRISPACLQTGSRSSSTGSTGHLGTGGTGEGHVPASELCPHHCHRQSNPSPVTFVTQHQNDAELSVLC